MTKAQDMHKGLKQRGNGQGTLYRSGKKWRWQITVGYVGDKRQTISGTATTKTEAHAALAQAQADYARGLITTPSTITLGDYAERWLTRQRQTTPRTQDLYRQELAYALEILGTMLLRDIRPFHIQEALTQLAARKMKGGRGAGQTMSPRTQSKVVTRLRAVFKDAVGDQILHRSPMDSVRRVKGKGVASVGQALDLEEATRFRRLGQELYADGLCRLWPALFMAISVGMRRGEIMGLTWDCLDFVNGIIHIRQQLVQGKGGAVLEEHLKTEASRRDIHMPANLRTLLLQHRENQIKERERAGQAWLNTSAVFCTELGNWIYPDNLNRALNALVAWSHPQERRAKRGGLGAARTARLRAAGHGAKPLPSLTPHDLRHTYATLALRARMPVEVVSKKLGHARVSITLDIYRHVLDNEQREYAIDIFAMPTSS